MYRLKNKLNARIWYNPLFYNDLIISNEKDKVVKVYDLDDMTFIKELDCQEILYIRRSNNTLFCDNSRDCTIFKLDNLNEKSSKLSGITILPAYVDDQYIYSNYKTESGVKICKYDYQNLNDIALFNYQLSSDVKCIGEKMIFREKKFISRKMYCINKDTGQEQWMLDISEIGKAKESIGKIEGPLMIEGETILVAISNGKLIKVDAHTSRILWEINLKNYRLMLQRDVIINVSSDCYREISSDSGKTLLEYEMRGEYEKHGFFVTGPLGVFTVTETHVFIVHAMGCRMGCINRSTGKIDWSIEVGEGKVTLPNVPIIYRDKLYVLDDAGILHAYEPE